VGIEELNNITAYEMNKVVICIKKKERKRFFI